VAEIPTPQPGAEVDWVQEYLGDIAQGESATPSIVGGHTAAVSALDRFDVRGYAARRNEVWPRDRRGASRLSPYIRHGLLTLPQVWDRVAGGPARDVAAFRDELLWQEYARHLYARVGQGSRRSLRFAVGERGSAYSWPTDMLCISEAVHELQHEGWLPNQMRMWLASQWSVRDDGGWRDGEDEFFRHLLDGSRAANRLGWQWTVGALTGKPYGFSRWQVNKRAPGLCAECRLVRECPIEDWPPETAPEPNAYVDPRMRRADVEWPPTMSGGTPEAVWLTAESLGDADPALSAHPHLPVHFVWDIPLLTRLRLAPIRLVFLAQCLADLATRRDLVVHRGTVADALRQIPLAGTQTPVPGWRQRSAEITVVQTHPWPWLVPPHSGSVTSFTAWRRAAGV